MRKQKRFIQRKAFLWVLIFTITLIWGYAWVMMKASLNFMGPFTYSSFRFGTGTITMFIILFIFKIGFPDKKYWKHLFINGLLQTAAVFLLVMFAMKFVDAGKSFCSSLFNANLEQFFGGKVFRRKIKFAKIRRASTRIDWINIHCRLGPVHDK